MFRVCFKQWVASALCIACEALSAYGGGSGLNTVVIVNQDSSNSVTLGNYYCEQRHIPPDNLIRIHWTGGNISWNDTDLQTVLLNPLRTALAERQISNQIQNVVLSMDIPFQTVSGSTVNGTTSAIFYGAKDTGASEMKSLGNSYAFSEVPFSNLSPSNTLNRSFLTTMITADSPATARHLVDQGVNSDGTFPSRPVVFAKSSDPLRNIRYSAFDNSVFNTRIRGNCLVIRTNSDQPSATTNLFGYETGLASFSVPANSFIPGAIADSLTSFGGIIFGPNGQTSLLEFIRAGAAGSYGTVSEPSPDLQKFPDPQVYFYQSRGFTLAEAYYQSIAAPYQGLVVGEPLAAPFAKNCSGQWLTGSGSNSVLTGNASLALQFNSSSDRPVQQIDLFVDGKFFQTITNLPPIQGNRLGLVLNGFPTNYMVAANDTIGSIASNVTTLINSPIVTNISRIVARNFGDRIELRYIGNNSFPRPVPPASLKAKTNSFTSVSPLPETPFSVSSSSGTASVARTFLVASRNFLMQSSACGRRSINVSGTIQIGSWIQLVVIKTNGAIINVSATNQLLNATPFTLTAALITNINNHPALIGLDGVVAEDLSSDWSNEGVFNLQARGEGYAAANVRIQMNGSSNFVFSPASQLALDQNLIDLQPRNHLYVTAGSTNISLSFLLNTTGLPDGYHDLTAVAYEGNHVRTQTHITIPVRIRNSSLSATLTSDFTNSAPVNGTYHVQVSANAGDVNSFTLFSTGGELTTINNQPSASFAIDATQLGEGRHPFYALVTTASGLRFRTDTLWVRFTP